MVTSDVEKHFVAEGMIAEIKYKLTEYGIYMKINTCRFVHKKNSSKWYCKLSFIFQSQSY